MTSLQGSDAGPVLTVVIAAYNAAHTVANAVTSAFAAGARRVVVIDDGSQDGTAARAESAGAEVRSQENSGAAEARRNGAALVTTPYVIFLDADDELLPAGVRESIRILDSSAKLTVVGGRVKGFVGNDEWMLPTNFDSVTTESLLSIGYSAWPPAASVIRTSALREAISVQPPPLNPKFAEDFEMLIRLTLVGPVARHSEFAMRYEMSGGKSLRSAFEAIRAKESIRFHYADALGIAINGLSRHRAHAAANRRVAIARRRQGRPVAALCLLTLAYAQGALALVDRRPLTVV